MLSAYILLTMIMLTLAASFAMMSYAWHNSEAPGSRAFFATMILSLAWSVLTVFMLVTPDPQALELLMRIRISCVMFSAPLLVLIHTHVYPGADLYHRPYLQSLFFVPVLIALASIWVPGIQELGLRNFETVESGLLHSVTFTRGPLMQFQLYYSFLCFFYSVTLALRMAWAGDYARKRQAMWLVLGTLVPVLSHWAGMITGWNIPWYHWAAGLGLVGSICLSMALFRYQLLDWAHMAKSQVFDRLPDPVIKLDRHGCVRVYNSAARSVFDISNEHVGLHWEKLTHLPKPLVERVRQEMAAMRTGNDPRRKIEITLEGAEASRSWVVLLECAQSMTPQDTGLLLSFRDVSERKALEGQIRDHAESLTHANSRLEELVSFKNRLLSLVAHDLSGNIGTMVMVSSALQTKVENQVDDSSKKMLRLMVRSSVSVQEFFSNLIHWIARLDSSLEPQLKICDLQELIQISVEQLTPILLVQRQTVVVTVARPVRIAADPDMITAVIRNLISNAITASQPDQEIMVGIEDGISDVHLWVKDRGVGIPAGRLQLLLTGRAPAKDPEAPSPGFGIGLNVCRDFVEFHGGTLGAESVLGEGSRFHFTLPKTQPPRASV